MNNDVNGSVTQQEYYLRAHALYNAKEYDQALNVYQTITDKGSATWYNMGNCAFRLGNYTQARVYWKRALRGADSKQRADTLHNLQVLNKKQGIELVDASKFVDRGIQRMQGVPIVYLQMFFLVGWIGLWAYIKRWHTKERYLFFGLLVLVNSFVGVALLYRFVHAQQRTGIVVEQTVTLHAGPNNRYHTVGTIPAITECEVQEVCGEWCKVRSGQLRGWIKKECCELI